MNASATAVLLLAHGTPNRLSEMGEYLAHVTAGRPMPAHVVEELQHRYAAIGLRDDPLQEVPPLTRWTLLQAELLSQSLGGKVYVAMRNWHPFIAEVVAQMKADGVAHANVLCLAPQNSRTSTGLYRRALEKSLLKTPGPAFTFDFIAGWSDEPLLAQAFAENLSPALAAARAADPNAAILFTAHSVPCRTIMTPTNLGAPGPGSPASALARGGGGLDSQTRVSSTADDMSGMPMNMEMPPSSNTATIPYGFPSAGRYRVFVQMKHGPIVETAAFDLTVE